MRTIRTIRELREVLKPARSGRIGFVPTMGALHEGHLSLVRAAREHNDTVVMSIFVNPKQFEDPADLAAYVRDQQQDEELASAEGVDVVFAPTVDEMYPKGFSTLVSVGGAISETLEGVDRGRSFFYGIATVVAKLLLAVLPDTVYFGAKDAQQIAVVRRMVNDLNIPVELEVCETSREEDGLARSSRNARLSPAERDLARAVPDALAAVAERSNDGETRVAELTDTAMKFLDADGITLNYLTFADPDTLEEKADADGPTLLLVAATIGETRLIDNVLIGAS